MAIRKWSERGEKSKMFLLSSFFSLSIHFPNIHHKEENADRGEKKKTLIKSFLAEVIQFAIQTGKCL